MEITTIVQLINMNAFCFRYRAPKIKRQRPDEDSSHQPSLTEMVIANFQQKAVDFNARCEKYKNDPAAMQGEEMIFV